MFIGRASLGAEFEDRTSAAMLRAPVPEFLYEKFFNMALQRGFFELGDMGNDINMRATPQIGTAGAEYAKLTEMQLNLNDPVFTPAFKVIPELEKKVGQTIRVNRPNLTAVNSMTISPQSRLMTTGQLISTTPTSSFGSDQISITVRRYLGPYDNTQNGGLGAVAPYGFDQFDASFQIHRASEYAAFFLRYDYARFIDNFISILMGLGGTAVFSSPAYTALSNFYGGSSTTSLVTAYGAEAPLTLQTIYALESQADTANVPVFTDGCRVLVVPPIGLQELKQDPLFRSGGVFFPEKNPLFGTAYKGLLSKTHLFESTTLPTFTNGNAGMTVYQGHYFAPGVIAGGVAMPVQAALSSANNYGFQALVIWATEMGLELADKRYVFPVYFN